MSLTPSHPRAVMSPALGASIKLTPTPSPFSGARTAPRSLCKPARAEATLALRTVIGATTSTANSCDSLLTGRCFAYTAGAAAVVATVDPDHDHGISQRFYRARPTTNPINSSASIYGGPSTPTQNESRNRAAASLRDAAIGASPQAAPASNDWVDSAVSRAWTARDKIKAATCVSLSPDAKFLAVGETGYRPRVLIFSTAPDAPCDTPLSALSEHSFGVNCVAFSPDSRYLASLGSSQDGFLYVWSINARTGAATLHASNKCVSNINMMTWMGSKLITVGTRHVKVWKVDELTPALRISKPRQSDMFASSTHKALPGRNCTLGSLQDATFTSVCQVAPNKAIVASDKGDLCLIDETDREQPFSRLASADFAVSSMAVDGKGRLHLSNCYGELKTLNISDVLERPSPPPSPTARVASPTPSTNTNDQIGAVLCLADYIVTVDAQRAIRLSHLVADTPSLDEPSIGNVIHTLPAHGDSVLGVDVLSQPNHLDASYYTWAAGGTVIFWGQNGSAQGLLHITIEQIEGPDSMLNELRTVRASADASFLVAGDKLGVFRIMDCKTQRSLFESRAHSSEITSIAIMEQGASTMVASSSRDRTVQIFARTNKMWDLMQTLDEHVGAVNGILFSRDGTRLVSSSSDRSIVVRELVSRQEDGNTKRAFVMLRAVILKASPVSMAWDVDQEDILLVSTIDRQVHKYDLRNGQCLSSFRASDTDRGDAVVLSSLAHIPRGWGSPLIAGVSSTDKSIRVYDESGTLIARDWGHTEGVTDIAFVRASEPSGNESGEHSLVTVAVDGTIFVWGLALQSPHRYDLSKSVDLSALSTPSNPDLLATKPPLRRVISQSELARFQRSSDDGTTTPTGNRSPKLRKKLSKLSFAPVPKNEPSGNARENKLQTKPSQTTLRRNKNRSPTPPSPRQPQPTRSGSGTTDTKARSKAAVNEFGSLGASTEGLCRTLRAYRKRLTTSTETLGPELAREVERELTTTARTIGERAKIKEFDDTAMARLLDQYSERLVTMLDEKIAASVAMQIRRNSEAGMSAGSNADDAFTYVSSPTTMVVSPTTIETSTRN